MSQPPKRPGQAPPKKSRVVAAPPVDHEPDPELAEGLEKIILPKTEIVTAKGYKVTVEPWGIEQGALLMHRIEELVSIIMSRKDGDPIVLVREAYEASYEIVRETIGWTDAEMKERLYAEDLLELIGAVVKTCLLRDDGRGILKHYGGLAALATRLVRFQAAEIQTRSRPPTPTPTPSPRPSTS